MNQATATLARSVELARHGDRDAWGAVYRELGPRVYRLCRRVLPTPEDAEDATMDVFLKAQVRLDQYDPGRPFEPWVYRIAANHCWDLLRKRHASPERAGAEWTETDIGAPGPDPQEQLLAGETRQEIRDVVAKLEDRARLAIALRYFAELSYEEIAEVLGVNTTFVGVLLLRARRRMRRLLMEKRTS